MKSLPIVAAGLGFALIGAVWLAAHAQPIGTNTATSKLPLTTFANLPTCGAATEGFLWAITDQATAVAFNGATTGGGANHQPVYCNGTAWVQR